MTTYNPGDLLIFPDGRRRCVCEVTPQTDLSNGIVWFCRMDDPTDRDTRAWWMMQTYSDLPEVIPNIFRPEEYERTSRKEKS